jgi:hypothetical protein
MRAKWAFMASSLLVAGPASAIEMAAIKATVNECRPVKKSCCPSREVAHLDKDAICGEEPEIQLDQYGNYINGREQEEYNRCVSKVLDKNLVIDQYNGVVRECAAREAQEREAEKQRTLELNAQQHPLPQQGSPAQRPGNTQTTGYRTCQSYSR